MIDALAVYGPPGTGKTTYLTKLIKDFVDGGVKPHDIAISSFTKAGSQEIASRAVQGLHTGTIHSIAFRLLNLSRDQVLSPAVLKKDFAHYCGYKISGSNYSADKNVELEDGDDLIARVEFCRTKMLPFGEAPSEVLGKWSLGEFQRFAALYMEFLKQSNYYDFSRMLERAPAEVPFKILIVDEAQDLSSLQGDVVRRWSQHLDRVILAGDDDQAIFTWAGADPHFMRNYIDWLAEDGVLAGAKVLGQSYRIPAKVHKIAEKVAKSIKHRKDKEYKPRDFQGKVHRIPASVVAMQKFDGDDLILTRTNRQKYDIINRLRTMGIPFDEPPWPGPYKSDFGKALSIVYSQATPDEVPMNLIEKVKKCFRADAFNDWINQGQWPSAPIANLKFDNRWTMFFKKLMDRYGTFFPEPRVSISTIHGAKGREAARVYLLLERARVKGVMVDEELEKRTFYVGITRAKEELFLVHSDRSNFDV